MGIFIFDDSSTIRTVKSGNIVRLALEERDQPNDEVSLRLSAAFSPTTRSGSELGVFEKVAVGKEDSEAVSDLKTLHLDLLDLVTDKTDVVNITSLEYPRKPKPTAKSEQPAPEKSKENQP